jgi:hypothetical protein
MLHAHIGSRLARLITHLPGHAYGNSSADEDFTNGPADNVYYGRGGCDAEVGVRNDRIATPLRGQRPERLTFPDHRLLGAGVGTARRGAPVDVAAACMSSRYGVPATQRR